MNALFKHAGLGLGVLIFAASQCSAAVLEPRAERCGLGFPNCPPGYTCVRTFPYSTCRAPSSSSSARPSSSTIKSSSSTVRSSSTSYSPSPSPTSSVATSSSSRGPTGTSSSVHPSGSGYDPDPNDGKSYTGIVGVKDKVVPRLPVAVFQSQYPDAFNMFILALESLQAKDESIDTSYYQVSGIHGYPYVPWQYPASSAVNPYMGYCTHGSVIFTTWHRPYLLLLEQLLYREAVAIAKKFTGAAGQKYQAAAQNVRLCYWDWASSDTLSAIPAVVSSASIDVVKPTANGGENRVTIRNPLNRYKFTKPQPQDSGLEAETVRSSSANNDLTGSYQARRESTYNSFDLADYNSYSNGLEGIHNGIHVLVGEDMSQVPTSAFDPIFWLHHVQVDRLMAMYQASHPGVVLTPGPRSGTFALPWEGTDDLSTPLYPFRHGDGREWTSNDVKSHESIFQYGYSYPEVPTGRSGSDLQAYVIEQINRLYGPNLDDPSFRGAASGAADTPTARIEYGANVQIDLDEVPESHRILLYLGAHDRRNLDNARRGRKLVGVASIFTGVRTGGRGKKLNVTVPLTGALVNERVALRPEDAIPTLTKELYWVVEKVGKRRAEQVPVSRFKSLKIAVTSTRVEYSRDPKKLPVKRNPLTYYAPTEGKAGGLQRDQTPPVGEKAPARLDTDTKAANGTATA